MNTQTIPCADTIPAELMAELQEAVNRAATGIRNRADELRARESMDRIREEIYREHGLLDIGVPAIRELRDE